VQRGINILPNLRAQMIQISFSLFGMGHLPKNTHSWSVPDVGRGGSRAPTTFMCFALCTTCVCHLVIFISEESLFVDTIKLSVIQMAVIHLQITYLIL